MSEPESPYIHTLFQLHVRSPRAPHEIEQAFLNTFSSLDGRIVLEALFDKTCMKQMASERDMGRHDLFLEILDMMARGEVALRRSEGWIYDRPTDHPHGSPA